MLNELARVYVSLPRYFSLKQNTFNSKISISSLYNSTVYDGDKGSVILTLVFCIQPLILKFHDCTKSAPSCPRLEIGDLWQSLFTYFFENINKIQLGSKSLNSMFLIHLSLKSVILKISTMNELKMSGKFMKIWQYFSDNQIACESRAIFREVLIFKLFVLLIIEVGLWLFTSGPLYTRF